MFYLCRKPNTLVLGLTRKRCSTGTEFILSSSSQEIGNTFHFTDDQTIWRSWKTLKGIRKFREDNKDKIVIEHSYIADSTLLKMHT